MADNSELAAVQQQAGGRYEPDQTGLDVAVDFGNPHAEYARAQSEAAVFDLSSRAQIELTGRDRQKFLHNFCTNDIRVLTPGRGCEAFVTNVQGKVLGYVFAFAGEDALWLDSVAGSEERIVQHLDKYLITEDVEFRSCTADWGELLATGPDAAERLGRLGLDVSPLPPFGHFPVHVDDLAVTVRRVDLLGTPGYLLGASRDHLAELWQRLVQQGVAPCGSAAFHVLRIEAGMPNYGLDISDANLAQEVGRTAQAISFTKGCYLGQEPIARIDALGHVNQELRGLRLEGGPVPIPGSPIVAAGSPREIGRVTSSALSYSRDLPVALAYLRRNYTSPGAQVLVQTAGGEIPATVFWKAQP